jgi:hypothetical protein
MPDEEAEEIYAKASEREKEPYETKHTLALGTAYNFGVPRFKQSRAIKARRIQGRRQKYV